MKKLLLSICAVASLGSATAQCTVSISDTIYCLNDSAVAATVDTTGGSWNGLGVDSTGVFNPTLAGPGIHSINYLLAGSGGNTYNIDSSGVFSPEVGAGTTVPLGDDQLSGILPIGFSFAFYNVTYTDFYISSNGFITFSAGMSQGCCTGGILPNNGNPNNLIAFAWEDINPSSGGSIDYYTAGTAPFRKLIMNFINVPHFGSANNITVQVQLHETTNRIEIHTTAMPNDGGGHTMGIENNPGDTALVFPGRNSSGTWSLVNDYTAFYLGVSCAAAVVEVLPAPSPVTIAPVGSTTLCPGQSMSAISNFWGDSINTITWSTGDSAIYYTTVSVSDSITASVVDTNGCYSVPSNMIVVVQDSCVSVEEIAVEIANFYPNPVTGMLNIQFEDNFNREIKISDSFGKLIYSKKLSDKKISIDLHNYPVGMYLINVVSSKGTISRKIIKQ